MKLNNNNSSIIITNFFMFIRSYGDIYNKSHIARLCSVMNNMMYHKLIILCNSKYSWTLSITCFCTFHVSYLRQGQTVDRGLLKRLLAMFVCIGIYHDKFELPFLAASRTFFTREGQELLSSMDVAMYLSHVDQRLAQAADSVNSYLSVSTRRPLIEVVETCLISPHTQAIVSTT